MTVAELRELLDTFDSKNEVRITATWEGESPAESFFNPISIVAQLDPDTGDQVAIIAASQEWDDDAEA